jgi:hypothetical protein
MVRLASTVTSNLGAGLDRLVGVVDHFGDDQVHEQVHAVMVAAFGGDPPRSRWLRTH